MERYELRMYTNKQAMYYGLFFGLFLVVKFIAEVLVSGFALSGLLALVVPILAYKFAVDFRKKVVDSEEVGFGTYLRFLIYLFFFSSMFLAIAQYVYYEYINPDYVSQQVELLLKTLSEIKESAPMVEELKKQLGEVGLPSASTIAVQTIWIYIFLGLILGLPIAALVNRKRS